MNGTGIGIEAEMPHGYSALVDDNDVFDSLFGIHTAYSFFRGNFCLFRTIDYGLRARVWGSELSTAWERLIN